MDKYQLTSSARMNGLFSGTCLDRVPFISLATMYAGNLAGLSSESFFLNPQSSFDAQVLCSQLHTCDASPSFNLPGWDLEEIFYFQAMEKLKFQNSKKIN